LPCTCSTTAFSHAGPNIDAGIVYIERLGGKYMHKVTGIMGEETDEAHGDAEEVED